MAKRHNAHRRSSRSLWVLAVLAALGWIISDTARAQISRVEASGRQVAHCASTVLSELPNPSAAVSDALHCPWRPPPSTPTSAAPSTTPATVAPTVTTTGGLRVLSEPQSGFTPVGQAIAAARRSVDLTMYELADPVIEADLAAAAARGVAVRVILDHNLERVHNQPAYTYLASHGVEVVWADRRYPATHQKTLTVDHTTSIVMTANLVAADYPTTRDFLIVDSQPADVAAIETTFGADFTGSALEPPDGADLVWSPTNAQASILGVIDGATHSLAVENEEMGSPPVTAPLQGAARRGVEVTVTMTDSPSWHAAFATLVTAGVGVAVYPDTAHALYIHAKTVVADVGLPDAQAFVGSENFSSASLRKNRELGLDTANPAVVNALAAVVTADHNGAQPWHP